jgi:hypothetical protein
VRKATRATDDAVILEAAAPHGGVGTVWDGSSDEELLDASRREPAAFGVFYGRHAVRMLRYFLGHVGDAEVAADLTAEIFAAALAGAHRFRVRKGPAICLASPTTRWPRASGGGESRPAPGGGSGRRRSC